MRTRQNFRQRESRVNRLHVHISVHGIAQSTRVGINKAEGTLERANAYSEAFRVLERRIDLFLSLPLSSLDRMMLSRKFHDIGTH